MADSPPHGQVDDLLKQIRERVRQDWESAQDAINTLVRMQVAQGLAPLFLEQSRPYESQQQLMALMNDGLLDRAAFIQKPPELLRLYKRLFFSLDREPQRILEIGVKGGGSTAFWKAVFPAATVVGVDIKPRRWLLSGHSNDGVIYLRGDQSDPAQLAAIGNEHGPFDIVIDDGSHVT
jgi:cephalosporin hydroxylase